MAGGETGLRGDQALLLTFTFPRFYFKRKGCYRGLGELRGLVHLSSVYVLVSKSCF